MMFGMNTNQQYLPHVPFSLQTRAFNSDLTVNNEIQLQYPANVSVLEAAMLFNYGVNQNANVGFNGDPCVMVGPRKQMASKKDRHSKIYTSQGPRDRRVRLSIGIARKFFDLQEMLGFDKPSKTLDWLLSKSKASIKELVLSKSANNSSSQEEVVSVISHASKSRVAKNANLAKELRAKARARARERTKEKMCIKQLNEARIHQLSKNPQVPNVFGFHQQNGTATSTNGVQNWDYSNFVSQTNQLYAILDQHKFIN